MSLLPRSRKARARLLALAVIAPVLAGAVGLALYGLREGVSFFYTPSQAREAGLPSDRVVRVGGLVQPGSLVKAADGSVSFVVADGAAQLAVDYRGDLPDLFREGQGVVAQGRFHAGRFEAREVLAKHDENYMPPEVARGLRESGHPEKTVSRSLVEDGPT
jgi:cytochrome c-type biogenesis protein CcmE